VKSVLNDPSLAQRLVAGGRERVRAEFSEEAVVRRYRDLLSAVKR
jgi:glycosyltransferase involved in cell wall biosynthesis